MDNIFELHNDLVNYTYKHSPYQAFRINDPKPRQIHKSSVRDRLLHHAVYRVLYPIFDRTFVADSYSCRVDKGTHRALNRFRAFAYRVSKNHHRTCWVLKCDIKKFFASIDQGILIAILKEHISDTDTIWLLSEIISSFYSTKFGVGLPLGNLTSQLLVNIYMNKFDQFIKHSMKVKYYIRYADDFVILSSDKDYLWELLIKIGDFLKEEMNLNLHPDKISIRTIASGVDFLGWVHFPNHRVLRTTTRRRMERRTVGHPTLGTIQSYLGLLSHGNTRKLRKPLLEKRRFLLYSQWMYDFKNTESRVRDFWDKEEIFDKSLEKTRNGKRFVFWEGPPTANGLPHIGHFLTRVYKDVYGRYKTMRGFFVLRKAGWDTHGLPVEIQVEKELGFTNKKQIEEYGIAKFNRKARENALSFIKKWEEMTDRMGFWVDAKHPYVTYETNYTESIWNILKEIWDKGLLYQAHKVVPFCVRCGTPLSAHEVAQGYRTITDTAVIVKFPVIIDQFSKTGNWKLETGNSKIFILAWTTTPWTLPGNVALAVGSSIQYQVVKMKDKNEIYILAADLVSKILDTGYEILDTVLGSDLVGLEYEPLFEVPELKSETSYKIYPADFVTTTDGTGVVHTAVMYGEDDYLLGTQLNLPKFHTVNEKGVFIDSVSDGLAGKQIIEHGKKSKATEDFIIDKLKEKNLLLKTEPYEHDYPFCWRCDTPLLYYAKTSWFIRTSAINAELLANNATVNWKPEHIKDGRFGQWLREAKDWTLSRERYWGTPLPIWVCDPSGNFQFSNPNFQTNSKSENKNHKKAGCGHKIIIGSIKELEKLSVGSKNTYYVMRHSASTRHEGTQQAITNTSLENNIYSLTDEGRALAEQAVQILQIDGIDHIYTSPFLRTKETAEIAGKFVHTTVETDERLGERGYPAEYEGKESVSDSVEGAETAESVRTRIMDFMRDMESKYRNKKILIVTHGAPMYFFEVIAHGFSQHELQTTDIFPYAVPRLAEIRKLTWRKIPRNEYGELDLHRPFIDEVVIKCPTRLPDGQECKSKMRKIPDLIDVWFDSGAMPFAQWHYPFENKDIFKKQFPADFIVEAVDQTRGWFWSLLGISTLLGREAPFKNVLVLGHTLDEKGQKMSKSKGNFVPVMELMDTYGSDVLRWYFLSTVAAGESKAVIPKEIEDKLKGFFFTLQNCIKFYELYAETNNQKPITYNVEVISNKSFVINSSLDKWLMSRLHRTIQTVTENLDGYDVATAGRALEQFVIEDLSNWWIRRSRKRKDALPLLRLVLLEVSKLLAPFVPFMSEDIWHRLANRSDLLEQVGPVSVHLTDWPKVSKKYINNKLEVEMVLAREVIARGLAERKEKKLKVRQPLAAVMIKNTKFSHDIEILIKEELNVKQVKYVKSQPRRQGVAAPTEASEETDVMLDLQLTPELIGEGYARELMRQIQDMRKEAKYNMDDLVMVDWQSDSPEIVSALNTWSEEIKKDTVLKTLEQRAKNGVYDIEKETELVVGKKIWLGIKK